MLHIDSHQLCNILSAMDHIFLIYNIYIIIIITYYTNTFAITIDVINVFINNNKYQ